ncbi:MAG: bifunctional 4-hydroxy-2-oxoglutarate aldolase/2-dehydro-3-deoxy-phosphogluconate aldolase [Eubacteriales bacterium]|nr:bifunctional 4-hydroxy-2-oxoglutarate aldolase/2-dehydro-3-deoxy-phosphogluconate aldolase [Eubacteriales bacterium]
MNAILEKIAVLEKISEIGIVPVIKIDNPDNAVPLAKALAAGGLPVAEITFRTAEGMESIRRIARELPEILVGAGTVLTTEQVDNAIDAGAQFIVSPGFNPEVVSHCIKKDIPITPGCSCPSDMEKALSMGIEVVKFFPAEQSGGVDYIKAVAAPYTTLKFIPTGGINAQNLSAYLAFDRIIACGGSWMVKSDLLNEGKFDEITRITREAVKTMLGFKVAHIGINNDNEDEARKAAGMFEAMFGFAVKEGNSSIFAGDGIESNKAPGLGAKGHIGISTLSIKRAIAYLKRCGFEFNESSVKKNPKGEMVAIYLKDEVAGFAVHLVQSK